MCLHHGIDRQHRKHRQAAGVFSPVDPPQERQMRQQIHDAGHDAVAVEHLHPAHIEIMFHIFRPRKQRPGLDHPVVGLRIGQGNDPAADPAVDLCQRHDMPVVQRFPVIEFVPLHIPHSLGADCRIHGKGDAGCEHQQAAQIAEPILPQKSTVCQRAGSSQKSRRDQHTRLGPGQRINAHIKQHQKQIQIPLHPLEIDIDRHHQQHQEHAG